MEMGTLLHTDSADLVRILSYVVESLVLETQKSFLCLLLVNGCQIDDRNEFTSLMAADHRFPLDELTMVKKPVEGNKDAGETEDTDGDDDDDNEEEEDESGEEESDYEEDSDADDDAEANGDSESEDEDDDDDDDEDDDDEDNEDDDDDDSEDEEVEQKGPPSKKKK